MKRDAKIGAFLMAGALGVLAAAAVQAEIKIGPEVGGGKAPGTPDTPVVAVVPVKAYADELKMANGDQLHGTLQAMTGGEEGRLTWKHEQAVAPVEFRLEGMEAVALGERKAAGAKAHQGGVTLTNGDAFAADLVSVDDKNVLVDTWYAGKLTVPRGMVRRIEPGSNTGAALYTGPGSLDGWTSPNGDVKQYFECKDGVLSSTRGGGTVGREIAEMPEAVRFDFDLAWTQNSSISIGFFCDKIGGSYDSEGYAVTLQYGMRSAMLIRRARNEGTRRVGEDADLSALRGNRGGDGAQKAHVTVLADKKARKVVLMLDGKTAKEWTDSGEFKGNGKYMVFGDMQNSMKISNIRVAKWNGRAVRAGEGKAAQDTLVFVNGDALSGKILAVGGGKVRLETAYAEPMDIPLERVVEISFSQEKASKARRNPGDVRLQLAGGLGRLTVKMAELRDGVLKGSSQNFGDVSIPAAALAKIDLRPNEDKEDEPAKDSGKDGEGAPVNIIEAQPVMQMEIDR